MRKALIIALAAVMVGGGVLVGGAHAQDAEEPEQERQQAYLCIKEMDGGSRQPGFEGCFELVGIQVESERAGGPPTGRHSEPSVRTTFGVPLKAARPLIEAHRRGDEVRARLTLIDGGSQVSYDIFDEIFKFTSCMIKTGGEFALCPVPIPSLDRDGNLVAWFQFG
jgi:hypothetical protein